MAGDTPGRREGLVFPILLPIIVTVTVLGAISALGLLLLSAAAVDKNHALLVALAFTVGIMVLCTFVYMLGERKAQQQ
ncbi:MAG: hypothetical protein ACKVVP_06960 [Chloroflexota bacterium]